jgi:hypothetical protein
MWSCFIKAANNLEPIVNKSSNDTADKNRDLCYPQSAHGILIKIFNVTHLQYEPADIFNFQNPGFIPIQPMAYIGIMGQY